MTGKNKTILIIIAVLILAGLAVYLYFWFQDTNMLRKQAIEQVNKTQLFEDLSQKISQEKTRCQQFISQESGQFGEFEYCQRFIQWQNTLNLINK